LYSKEYKFKNIADECRGGPSVRPPKTMQNIVGADSISARKKNI